MDEEADLALVPHRKVVDGVPVYWSRYSGEPCMSIIFRVGYVDEAFAHLGVTHAVEHLALNALRGAPYRFNGQIGLTTTVFAAAGLPDELVAFAANVCASLRNLHVERLRHELQVLQAEAQARVQGLARHLLSLHCGFTPYGRTHLPEFGLTRLRERDVTAWAAEWFTRDNVAVWIAGELPDGLAFDLPQGRRKAIPEPTVTRALKVPCSVNDTRDVVALSAVRPWNLPLKTAVLVAGQRLLERLRFQEGISYRTFAEFDRITASTGMMVVMADCVSARADKAVDALLDIMSDLAKTGSVADDLQTLFATTRRYYSTRESIPNVLQQWAFSELAGMEVQSMASILDEMAKLRPEAIAAAMSEALETALLVVPRGCSPRAPMFPLHRADPGHALSGRTFRHRTSSMFTFGAQTNCIVLSDAGITRIDEHGDVTTVLFESCAGLVKASGGSRLVLGDDRQTLAIAPEDWRDGPELVGLLDAAVPDDRTSWAASIG